ncbi:Protein 21.1 [Anopheles sinensis]|uniref:Protein 21.1 n=1 Tax=Anopheles sinensis TaxID=74873 RepID=A0A084WF42_ANOSI|nr:Protein 21.1 [Anopheles sinensis]
MRLRNRIKFRWESSGQIKRQEWEGGRKATREASVLVEEYRSEAVRVCNDSVTPFCVPSPPIWESPTGEFPSLEARGRETRWRSNGGRRQAAFNRDYAICGSIPGAFTVAVRVSVGGQGLFPPT